MRAHTSSTMCLQRSALTIPCYLRSIALWFRDSRRAMAYPRGSEVVSSLRVLLGTAIIPRSRVGYRRSFAASLSLRTRIPDCRSLSSIFVLSASSDTKSLNGFSSHQIDAGYLNPRSPASDLRDELSSAIARPAETPTRSVTTKQPANARLIATLPRVTAPLPHHRLIA